MKPGNAIALAIVFGLLFIGGVVYMTSGRGTTAQVFQLGGQDQQNQPSGFSAGTCPMNGQTTLTLNLRNGEDDTATVYYNATAYLFGSKGHFVTVTNTDGGTATLNCGETYTLKAVSADGNRGDNAKIVGIDNGVGATLGGDGTVTFTPAAAAYTLSAVGSFHGVPEFRVYNIDNGAWRYQKYTATSGNVNTWALTGKEWNGTTSENTTITVGAGQSFTDEIHFRANESVTDAADFGYYIFVDAATSKFAEPTIRLDGIVLSKTAMPADEARQWGSTYEYAYKVDGRITDSEHVLKTEFKALSGVNPADTDSPTVAVATVGAYKATASNTVKLGAAKDDSSATAVFTIQTAKLLIG